MKLWIPILLFLFSHSSWALETRVHEVKFNLYAGYSLADRVNLSGGAGFYAGKKFASDTLENFEYYEVSRFDKAGTSPIFGMEAWYFIRPDFAWLVGGSFEPRRSVSDVEHSFLLANVLGGSDLEDTLDHQLKDEQKEFNASFKDEFTKYSFTLLGAYFGFAVVLLKKVIFTGAINYYYVNPTYNDLTTASLVLGADVDFSIKSEVGFRVGLGWFLNKRIHLGLDYNIIRMSHTLEKSIRKGTLLDSVLDGFGADKSLRDYYKGSHETLTGHLSGLQLSVKYFF